MANEGIDVREHIRQKRERGPIIKEPRLLVFKEKHGNQYFHIPDDKTLFVVALAVLTSRFNEGYWYSTPEEIEKPEPLDFTEEQVKAMPASMRKSAEGKLHAYKRSLRDYNEAVESYEFIEKAIRDKDGRAAWEALREHSDGEYEGLQLEDYSTPEELSE